MVCLIIRVLLLSQLTRPSILPFQTTKLKSVFPWTLNDDDSYFTDSGVHTSASIDLYTIEIDRKLIDFLVLEENKLTDIITQTNIYHNHGNVLFDLRKEDIFLARQNSK